MSREQLDAKLLDRGVSASELEDVMFAKTAMISRVIHNINLKHTRKTGRLLFDADTAAQLLEKTSSALAVTDLVSINTLSGRIDKILSTIQKQL